MAMPDDVEADVALIHEAARLRDEGNTGQAIELYSQLLRKYPRKSRLYEQRASTKSEHGDLAGAIVDFSKAIELDGSDPALYEGRGCAKSRMRDYAAAVLDFETAIELLLPVVTFTYNGRGAANWKLGKLDEAIADLRLVIQLDPSYESPYYNLAAVLLEKGDTDEALTLVNRAIELIPDDAVSWALRGDILKAQAKDEDARASYLEAARLDPKSKLVQSRL